MLINWCREQIAEGRIMVKHIPTERNIADILTKEIYGRDFQYKTQRLLGKDAWEEDVEPVSSKRKLSDEKKESDE